MAGEGIAGIGSAAGEFAKGFMQARMQNAQLALEQHTQKLRDIQALSEGIDRFKDAPQLQAAMIGHLNDMVSTLPTPPKTAKDTGGVIGFFKNMFHHASGKPGAPPAGGSHAAPPEQPASPSALPPPPALAASGEGSHTFGNLGDMFGREVEAKPAASPIPFLNPSGAPAPAGTGAQDTPWTEFVPKAPPASTAGPAAPAAPAAPPAAPSNGFMPRPDEIVQQAIDRTMAKIPGVAVGGVRNPLLEQRYTQQVAAAHADHALSSVEKILAANPDVRTLSQAYTKLGPDFAHVMDTVQQYENTGFLPKGRLESWQKRFDDVRFGSEKYDSRKTVKGADGNEYQHNPVNDKYDIIVGGPSFESKLNDAFSKPPAQRTPAEANMINGEYERLQQKAKANTFNSPDEKARWDYLNSLPATLTPEQKMDRYMTHAHPPQPSTVIGVPGISPQGQAVHNLYDRKGSLVASIPTTGPAWEQSRFEKEIQKTTPNPSFVKPDGTHVMQNGVDMAVSRGTLAPKQRVLDASKLINAYNAGDRSVSAQLLKGVLNNGDLEPEDRKQLQNFVNALPDTANQYIK